MTAIPNAGPMTAAIIGPMAVPIAIMIAMTIMLAAVEPIQEVSGASAEMRLPIELRAPTAR